MKNVWTIALAFAVTACGYQAVYKESAETFKEVYIANVSMEGAKALPGERRVAQLVNHRLEEVLTGDAASMYKLDLEIEESSATLAVLEDATEDRFNLSLTGKLTVKKHTGEMVFDAVELSVSAPYNVEDSPYSTEAGKTSAREDAAKALAEEVIQYLNFYL